MQLLPKEWGSKWLAQTWRHLSTIKAPILSMSMSTNLWTSGSCRAHWRREHCTEILTWLSPIITELHHLSHLWVNFQWYPKDWYDAVILYNENCIANSHSNRHCNPIEPLPSLELEENRNPVTGFTRPVHSAPAHAMAVTPSIRFTSRPPQDPNAMDVDVTQRWGPNPHSVLPMCEDRSHQT